MRRLILLGVLCLSLSGHALAQGADADTPATRDDIERYLQVMHIRDTMGQMMDTMLKPMHQMMHDELAKSKDGVSPQAEARLNAMIDEMAKNMPVDDMLEAMVPVYQKYFTKGDIDALIAFYSSPTGQKMIRQMPQVTAEAMQALMPVMMKQTDAMSQHIKDEIAKEQKEAKTPATRQ
jgi:hypothetical protein